MIVAADAKNGIGIRNTLPWHLSDDLKRFKEITTGHTVIMGRNTWFSLPKRPLPNRRNIVLTPDPLGEPGAEEVKTMDEVFELCKGDAENFVIGGASMYEQLLPHTNKLYLTCVDGEYDTDTFFPELNENEWELVDDSEIMVDSKSGIQYQYLIFIRRK
jgi:dihydrofolate reductase